jgi:Holliday junction resolvase-like predicted endonuclease
MRRHWFYYSPELVRSFRVALQNYIAVAGQPMTDYIAREHEKLVAAVLRRAGYQCDHEGAPALNLRATRTAKEVDVVAWNDEQLLLVDVKAEAEPPGAWADAGVENRSKVLRRYDGQLGKAVDQFVALLKNGTAECRQGPDGRLPFTLPAGIANKAIRGLIVSFRVEPRTNTRFPVRTFMVPLAADVARRRLPVDKVMPVWDGQSTPF